ncbi:hypothetical protein NIES30_21700 [Phormidium tenue NIES-30]|uniref:Uncharacterized protein n=2 Tax=Phormidium tenue TaxID=126344 RepID=A0A1U7IZY9_9CYAN|nr:hypothetical protein NIES30_21700 [Phormidium tenue NIES-30]
MQHKTLKSTRIKMNPAKKENIAKRIWNASRNSSDISTLNEETQVEYQNILSSLEQEWEDKLSRYEVVKKLNTLLEVGLSGNAGDVEEALSKEDQKYQNYNIKQTVYLPVKGMQFFDEQREKSLEIGKVVFLAITSNRLAEIFDKKKTIIESTRHSEIEKVQLIEASRKYLTDNFAGKACSLCEIVAEPRKAEEIAVIETSKALEVLRYAIPAFPSLHIGKLKVELGISGDTRGGKRIALLMSSSGSRSNWERSTTDFEITSKTKEELRRVGVFELSSILLKSDAKRTPFEKTILRFLHWISESHIQTDLENQLLLLVIALETLLGSGKQAIDFGAAMILEETKSHRKELKEKIGRICDIRNDIVHGSKSINIGEMDVLVLREVTMRLMIKVLDLSKNNQFNTSQDLKNFVEEKQLS